MQWSTAESHSCSVFLTRMQASARVLLSLLLARPARPGPTLDLLELPMNLAGYMSVARAGQACELEVEQFYFILYFLTSEAPPFVCLCRLHKRWT